MAAFVELFCGSAWRLPKQPPCSAAFVNKLCTGCCQPARLGPHDCCMAWTVRQIGREVLDEAGRMIKPGVTTDDIDRVVHDATVKRNSYRKSQGGNGF